MAARTLAQAILLSEAEKREGSATGAVCLQQGLPKQGTKDESERLKPVTFGHLSEALVRLAGVLRSPMSGASALSPGSVAAIGGGLAASVWSWSSESSIPAAPSSFTVKAESPAGEAPVSFWLVTNSNAPN